MQFKRYSSDAVTPDAQYDLGDAHYYGQGVPSDYAEAVKWNSKAAEQGHSEAESRVAGRTGAAKESLRTTLNRRGGFAKPLSKAMHAPSASSVLYTITAKGSLMTTLKLRSRTSSPTNWSMAHNTRSSASTKLSQFEMEVEAWSDHLVKNERPDGSEGASLYDGVFWDSLTIEKPFIEALERRKDVRPYFRLPDWFLVNTPIGKYNPDCGRSEWTTRKTSKESLFSTLFATPKRP